MDVAIDNKIYQAIIGAKALSCKPIKSKMQTIKNIYCRLLSFHAMFLNFNENMGISETKKKQNKPTKMSSSQTLLSKNGEKE